jgi:thioredoxin reductase (NADPH)
LSAAVYGASEGLQTVLIESQAFGGQAGTSPLIRNYLGFPLGVSGQHLATRASEQAAVFGAESVIAHATGLASTSPCMTGPPAIPKRSRPPGCSS